MVKYSDSKDIIKLKLITWTVQKEKKKNLLL